MTEITITPNFDKKTARIKGTFAVGEDVKVSIAGAIQDTDNLRLRIIGHCGKTVARFPELDESGVPKLDDTWETVSLSGLQGISCNLNMNTKEALGMFCENTVEGEVSASVVLENMGEGQRTLFIIDGVTVKNWPLVKGEDTPTDLNEYPMIIAELKDALSKETNERINEDHKLSESIETNSENIVGVGKSLNDHIRTTSGNPHHVTASEVGAPSDVEFSALESKVTLQDNSLKAVNDSLAQHINTVTGNPHHVTVDDVGTYGKSTIDGKIKTVSSKIDKHIGMISGNPHHVTAFEIGAMPRQEAENIHAQSDKKISDHINDRNNPHHVTAEQVDAYTKAEVNVFSKDLLSTLKTHTESTHNPHHVTAGQIDVYTKGETYNREEVRGLITPSTAHIDNKENPHRVTADQVGAYTREEVDKKIEESGGGTDCVKTSGENIVADDWSIKLKSGYEDGFINKSSIQLATPVSHLIMDGYGLNMFSDISPSSHNTVIYTVDHIIIDDHTIMYPLGSGTLALKEDHYTKEEVDKKIEAGGASTVLKNTANVVGKNWNVSYTNANGQSFNIGNGANGGETRFRGDTNTAVVDGNGVSVYNNTVDATGDGQGVFLLPDMIMSTQSSSTGDYKASNLMFPDRSGTFALTSDIPNPRYNVVTLEGATVTLSDRAVNSLALSGGACTVAFPAIPEGYTVDCLLFLPAFEGSITFPSEARLDSSVGDLAGADGTQDYLLSVTSLPDGSYYVVCKALPKGGNN